MPNWCSTTITIWDDNTTELGEFARLLDKWTSKNYIDNGFGESWLGNVVLGSGIGTVDTNSKTDVRCRGSVAYSEYDGKDCLRVDTETAWAPLMNIWVKLRDKYFPDGTIVFTAEEPGCEIYATNDEDLIGKWVIDSWSDNIDSDWEATEERVVEVLQKLLNSTETNVNKLVKELYSSDIEGISVHKWEQAEIEDYL